MVRVITQATYDEVVKENIDDLDMGPEEAIEEAIAQFQAQGVDLSNIIKDLALHNVNDDHLISKAVKNIQTLLENPEVGDEELIRELKFIKSECDKDIAYRLRAGNENAYSLLLKIIQMKESSQPVLENTLQTMRALTNQQPDILDEVGISTMKRLLDEQPDLEIQSNVLKWISMSCWKHEKNRQKIFDSGVTSNLKSILATSKHGPILHEVCQVMRRLVLDDDIRVEYGRAHDHAKELAEHNLGKLTSMLTEFKQDSLLVSELLLTISSLLVRHEFCAMVQSSGGVQFILSVMEDYPENVTMMLQVLKLIKALAGNDDVKRSIVLKGGAKLVITTLTAHMENPDISELALGCIAALALREPKNSVAFYEAGAAEAIVACMKIYPDSYKIQRNGSWAIRNMAARCREHSVQFLEQGAEPVLNKALKKYADSFGFDVKSALRDLGCDVKFDEQWKGTGVKTEY